jgi:hypothetical protein
MFDALSALSLYRQLEALDNNLSKIRGDDVTNQFLAAYTNQASFNHILEQVTEQCADSPEYLKSFSHIKPAKVPKGADRSVYPGFLAKVQMLKQAVGAFIELAMSSEQKTQIGFR